MHAKRGRKHKDGELFDKIHDVNINFMVYNDYKIHIK